MMLAGAILCAIVLSVIGYLLWLFIFFPIDGEDEHADPDNFGV